jgi:hypothetical protein
MLNHNIFLIGQKVKIAANYWWASNVIGVISAKPYVIEGDDSWVENYHKTMKTPQGEKKYYWVKLDSPCLDADGDGPYQEGEFDSDFLITV